jgi:FkbM family methyltransferase
MLIRLLLRRKLFKGQFKAFLWLRKHGLLKTVKTIGKPITGNFRLKLDTSNFIDSCIYYTGDYEPYLKLHYKELIKQGDTVLDVGANIGFHSMYFAELVGKAGKVLSFEPIEVNFNAFKSNLQLNDFPQIMANNIALGNENEDLAIHLDIDEQNPGAFNLLAPGDKNYTVKCEKGDDFLKTNGIEKVNFIKIDVEGYEYEVMKGMKHYIQLSRPIINFEYDKAYQSKNNEDPSNIFNFLSSMNYNFYKIDGYGNKKIFILSDDILGAEIIAMP